MGGHATLVDENEWNHGTGRAAEYPLPSHPKISQKSQSYKAKCLLPASWVGGALSRGSHNDVRAFSLEDATLCAALLFDVICEEH